MPGIEGYDCEGILTIGAESMNRPAWAVIGEDGSDNGLVQLWATAELRGDDRVVPYAVGVIPYPRRLAATRFDLRILITGNVDRLGNDNADAKVGLEENLAYLWTNVLTPVTTGGGTRAATLTMPSGAVRSADIHVLGLVTTAVYFSPDDTQAIFEGRLQISIPGGRFA